MDKVAATSDGHCIERAISTMRLALGYETGLPNDWQVGKREIPDVVVASGRSFLDRKVLVWHNENLDSVDAPPNVESYQVKQMPELACDGYLVAFVYGGSGQGLHMVIGTPVQYNDNEFVWPLISLVIAVELTSASGSLASALPEP